MPRRAARIDENQPEIVRGLRRVGASVESLAAQGGGVPDLLVGFRGRNYLIEVKNPDKPARDRQLTKAQVPWHQGWDGQVNICETLDECLEVIGLITKTP